jgi:hypothetical protein
MKDYFGNMFVNVIVVSNTPERGSKEDIH